MLARQKGYCCSLERESLLLTGTWSRFVLSIFVSSFTTNLCGFIRCWHMASQEYEFPLHWWAISGSASKIDSSVCKGANVHGYKIKKKVSGKIEVATSETQHTPTQIWLKKIIRERKKLPLKINKQTNKEPSLLPSTLKCYDSCLSLHEGFIFTVLGFLICWLCTLYDFYNGAFVFMC